MKNTLPPPGSRKLKGSNRLKNQPANPVLHLHHLFGIEFVNLWKGQEFTHFFGGVSVR